MCSCMLWPILLFLGTTSGSSSSISESTAGDVPAITNIIEAAQTNLVADSVGDPVGQVDVISGKCVIPSVLCRYVIYIYIYIEWHVSYVAWWRHNRPLAAIL